MTDKKNIELSMIPFVPWSVYMIADKKGFWKKYGLTVDICINASEKEYVASLNDKSADMYPLPLSSVLELAAEGNRFVCTGFFDLADGHKKIVVKKNYKNLKGKKIILYCDEVTNRYFLSNYLSTINLTLSDVDLIFCDSNQLPDIYSKDDIAACLIFEEPLDKILETSDSTVVFTTGDYNEPFTIAVPAEKYTTQLQQNLPAFIKGRMDAVVWIQNPLNQMEFSDLVVCHLLNGSSNYGTDQIIKLFYQLRTPSLKSLYNLNRGMVDDIFNRLTHICETNNIVEKECLKEFSADSILKNQDFVRILNERIGS